MRLWFFTQKYRFDLGVNHSMVFVNFFMLAVVFVKQLGLSLYYVGIAAPMLILFQWVLGYMLDKRGRAGAEQEKVWLQRNPLMRKHFETTEGIHEFTRRFYNLKQDS